jgi:hypothetical protein
MFKQNCKFQTAGKSIDMSNVSLTHIAATKAAVAKFDELLQHITVLKRENHELKEVIRDNEIKAGLLIDHYKSEIDAQTLVATGLRHELRGRDEMELMNRNRDFRDASTWMEELELASKENELFAIIYMLEDEIQSLQDDRIKQNIEFGRKTIDNRENIKKSFLRNVNNLRSEISNCFREEVRGAIAETIRDNNRLKSEFRSLLHELEKLQESREKMEIELSRTRRELELLRQMNELGSNATIVKTHHNLVD